MYKNIVKFASSMSANQHAHMSTYLGNTACKKHISLNVSFDMQNIPMYLYWKDLF